MVSESLGISSRMPFMSGEVHEIGDHAGAGFHGGQADQFFEGSGHADVEESDEGVVAFDVVSFGLGFLADIRCEDDDIGLSAFDGVDGADDDLRFDGEGFFAEVGEHSHGEVDGFLLGRFEGGREPRQIAFEGGFASDGGQYLIEHVGGRMEAVGAFLDEGFQSLDGFVSLFVDESLVADGEVFGPCDELGDGPVSFVVFGQEGEEDVGGGAFGGGDADGVPVAPGSSVRVMEGQSCGAEHLQEGDEHVSAGGEEHDGLSQVDMGFDFFHGIVEGVDGIGAVDDGAVAAVSWQVFLVDSFREPCDESGGPVVHFSRHAPALFQDDSVFRIEVGVEKRIGFRSFEAIDALVVVPGEDVPVHMDRPLAP